MILTEIYPYNRYRHIASKRICVVSSAHAQVKLSAECGFGTNNWTTGVIYSPEDKTDATFVVDVDSFRRKFEEIKVGEET